MAGHSRASSAAAATGCASCARPGRRWPAQRESYDLAVVDLFVKGGGVDLARRLTRRVPRVYLSVGPKLLTDELLEPAIGFPVLRKRDLPDLFA